MNIECRAIFFFRLIIDAIDVNIAVKLEGVVAGSGDILYCHVVEHMALQLPLTLASRCWIVRDLVRRAKCGVGGHIDATSWAKDQVAFSEADLCRAVIGANVGGTLELHHLTHHEHSHVVARGANAIDLLVAIAVVEALHAHSRRSDWRERQSTGMRA